MQFPGQGEGSSKFKTFQDAIVLFRIDVGTSQVLLGGIGPQKFINNSSCEEGGMLVGGFLGHGWVVRRRQTYPCCKILRFLQVLFSLSIKNFGVTQSNPSTKNLPCGSKESTCLATVDLRRGSLFFLSQVLLTQLV